MFSDRPLLAARFRQIAREFERLGRGESGDDAQTANEAGQLVVAAFHAGYLPPLPGLAELVEWAENPPWGTEFDEAHGRPRAGNVFSELVGNHLLVCRRLPDGSLKSETGRSSGGILPELVPGVLPGVPVQAPDRWRDECNRKAAVCEWLAATVEAPPKTGDVDRLVEPVPLTDQQREVLEFIRARGTVAGKEIAGHLGVSESTVTRHYIPALKAHGVRNRRGAGYYLPDQK